MTGSPVELVVSSPPSASTGCVAGLVDTVAGCADEARTDGTAGDLPLAGDASTGCAAAAARDVEPDKPQPPQTKREFQHALRGLGFSQRQAAEITRKGFTGAADDGEPQPDDIEAIRVALRKSIAALKGTP